uniref:Hypothetical membrane protein n=2 Tax=Thermococcus sp. AMT11 TaxID=563043 RepID=C8BND6_9EURY|nr:hypothetical membrane protein [Thermococcus sp. AMT11]
MEAMTDYALISEFFIKVGVVVLLGTFALFVSHDFVVVTKLYKKPIGDGIFFGSWMFQLVVIAMIISQRPISVPNSPLYLLVSGIFFGWTVWASAELQWKFAKKRGYLEG